MKLFLKSFLMLLIVTLVLTSCGSSYKYETVKSDPIKARIYTLDNGLKVYMTTNQEQPRIQTLIAVKVGGKNDPAETTGLAHYFEHLMFKGTQQIGTQNYEAEKPLLDEIERLFETYRQTTDLDSRESIYHLIDSISYEASKLSIPSEYDKLMAAIGANGTNAWTSFDETVYTEDIPSNQIENWAKIQADRFQNNVIRGFHTELETVYEEKNMSQTNDGRKVQESLLAALYPHHPYGKQTVLGTQEHLKNPSITNIKQYFKTYYVPNNMAICLSGDFNPDTMIAIIDKYFGTMKPNENLPKLSYEPEKPITEPIVKEVLGLDAQHVRIGWRSGKASSKDAILTDLIGSLLDNGKAGLIDVNLIQTQKVLSAGAWGGSMADYGMLTLNGRPKAGQTLEEVKDLLLAEVAKLRNGEFDESLIKSIVANYKLYQQRQFDSNSGKARSFVSSFINEISWKDYIAELDIMSKITKEEIVKFANENFKDNNFVVIYKREGKDPNEQKINKPKITPIFTNRDAESDFLAEIKNTKVQPIAPVFIDFNKDMSKSMAKNNIEVLYKKNETTDLFTLIYLFEIGTSNDPYANMAFDYMKYLGTSTKTLEQINREFYDIACNFNVYSGSDRSYITISGLNENMNQAMKLMEEVFSDAQPNQTALENIQMDFLKKRENNKKNQSANFSSLRRYAMYGPEYIKATTLTDEQILNVASDDLLAKIKALPTYEHKVLYYGKSTIEDVVAKINNIHQTPDKLIPISEQIKYYPLPTPINEVMMAEYDAKQIYYVQISNNGEKYDLDKEPITTLYRQYFGGGMNAIVFQEMREARGLAYSASASFVSPDDLEDTYTFQAIIATQNDKMNDAFFAFEDIINNMPKSEKAFEIAKSELIAQYETQRIIKEDVLWNYLDAVDLGLNFDKRKFLHEKIQGLTLDNVIQFQEENIKGRTYKYCVLGNIKDLDVSHLEKIAPIKVLTKEEIFGY